MFANIRGPVALIIQGAAIALVGLVVVIANLGSNTSAMQIDKGQIADIYEHTTGGVYDATWITLTNNELYVFDKTKLNPNWNNAAFKNQKIDIYYEDATPRQVMAIQLYDQFGDPTAKYTTPAYEQNPNTYQKPGAGPGVGEFIMALGVILAAIGGYLTYMRRRNGFV
jgi:hypothetical protein